MNITAQSLRFKQEISHQYTQAIELYKQDRSRPDLLLSHLRKIVDRILKEVEQHYPLPPQASLCAVGGYGRGELYPCSDIDLLILLKAPPTPAEQELLEVFIAALWDLGLEVGHSVRTVDECLEEASKDITIETGLLESRLILGDRSNFLELENRFKLQLNPASFYRAKALEYKQRHARYAYTPYALEPNCKESPGGIRDIQLINWIARAAGIKPSWHRLVSAGFMTENEALQMKVAETNYQRLRIELHLLSRKNDDRLLFDAQIALARELGIQPEESKRASELLMQMYYQDARTVYVISGFMMQIFESYFFENQQQQEELLEGDFRIIGEELDVIRDDAFLRKPQLLLKTFLVFQQNPQAQTISVRTQRLIWDSVDRIDDQFRNNPVNHWLFIQILQQPIRIVQSFRMMNFLNVLPAYLPAFEKIVGQMQHDLYHVYTVDQHSLMVIRNIRRFSMPEFSEENPLAHQLMENFDERWLLYIAALFHDIAKGRGGDHSELGAQEVVAFAKLHNLEQEDVELLQFLVAEHLLMSNVAQKRDLSDEKVIRAFAARVGTQSRLAALYLLTVADIRGTSPKVWNSWKAKLIENLYYLCSSALGDNNFNRNKILEQRKKAAKALIEAKGMTEEQRDLFWSKMDNAYFLRHEPEDIAWHTLNLFEYTDTDKAIVRARPTDRADSMQILVFIKDQDALFERIASYFHEQQINIYEAQIHTSSNGYALDSFLVESSRFSGDASSFAKTIEINLATKLDLAQPLKAPDIDNAHLPTTSPGQRRSRSFPVRPRVQLDREESGRYWRLQVNTTDTPGILYSLAHIFSQFKINLRMARLLTLGERVEDIFIIEGTVLESLQSQLDFERAIIDALNELLPSTTNQANN
ncbi:MAG: [protein-PII] uridylyltransferase [Alcaligenaceae bacterium]|nr:[protein-PII] uridylyltransferase [Alcaligenaceae bacterium]